LFGLWNQNYPIQTNKQRTTLSNKINFHSSLCRLVGMGVSGRSPHERGLGVSFSAVVWGRVFSKAGFCNMEP